MKTRWQIQVRIEELNEELILCVGSQEGREVRKALIRELKAVIKGSTLTEEEALAFLPKTQAEVEADLGADAYKQEREVF